MLFLVLFLLFMLLLFVVFRPPMPGLDRLLAFLLLLAVAGALAYFFVVRILDVDPDPARLSIARGITANKIIDLSQIVPGLGEELDLIHRLDTDAEPGDRLPEEWVVFYRYDVSSVGPTPITGPFGGAIYDADRCRPPSIQSYELRPISYDYLGQTWAAVTVENAIAYGDPRSGGLDRPEVIIAGYSPGNVVTDLNFFRKLGVEPNCLEIQAWRDAHPGEPVPYGEWLSYENIGSFRGNFLVQRDGTTVTVSDRSPFERSQIVIRRQYRPDNGSYFIPGTETLLNPVEVTLGFGTGRPDVVPQVYYPEKAVLAFYLSLTRDAADLERARSYLSAGAQDAYDIDTDPFGLSTRAGVVRVLVWEIRYDPDIESERLHRDRQVTVVVAGVNADGRVITPPCQVTWRVIGVENASALPYGCEWRLDRYLSTCPGPDERGQWERGPAGTPGG